MSDVEPLGMQDQPELEGQSPGFPGHLLRQAREKKGLSQKEVARDLHLTSKVINAIEEDNFELIPSSLFARGYIRSFARHVGLDGQALVAEFDAVYGAPNHGTKPMPGIPKGGSQSKPSDTWVKLTSIIFAIGLLAASIVWWQIQNGGLMFSQSTSVVVDAPASETDDGDDSIDLVLLTTTQSDVGATVPAEEPASAAEPNIQSEEVEVVEVVAAKPDVDAVTESVKEPVPLVAADVLVLAPDEAQLIMVFDKDCWVEIKDGKGKMILSDLYSAGDTIDQVVTAPIEVLLGRSSGVATMTFDGQAIDLKPHTRKDIARLTLNK